MDLVSNQDQDLAPALIESIKTAGLVLVSDITDSGADKAGAVGIAQPRRRTTPDGVDGFLVGDGVLCFNETVDM
jgi:CDK inhibitor PHO81